MFRYQKENRRERAVAAGIGVRERVGRGVGSFLPLCWNPLGSRPSRFVELESVVTRRRLGPALGYFWTLIPRNVCGRRGCVKRHELPFFFFLFRFEFDATEKSRKQQDKWKMKTTGAWKVCNTAGRFYPVPTALCNGSYFILSDNEKNKCEWPADSPSYCRLAAIGVSHLPMSAVEGRHWRAPGEGVG